MPQRLTRDANNNLVPLIFSGGLPDNVVVSADIADNSIVNADLATGVFGKITGVGAQAQTLDMGTQKIDNVADIACGQIRDETDTVAVFTITDTTGAVQLEQDLTIADATNIILNATTGTQIGTATTQKLGFYGATPVVQPTALTAEDSATVDATYGSEESGVLTNVRTRVGEIETKLQALGLLA
jgi:hypothetical protein